MEAVPFLEVGAILGLALVAGLLAKLLRQPAIVAYIIVGVVVGPSVLGLSAAAEGIEVLAKLGIAVLLFLVGLKLDVHLVRSIGPVALLTGVGQVVFTSIIGFGIVLLFDFDVVSAIYIAVALTFSSTIIIVKLLSDKRELDQLHGRIAVGFLIVQDILVVVAMLAIVTIGDAESTTSGAELLYTLFGTVGFLIAIAAASRFVVPRLLAWIAKSSELTLLFGVAWAVALAALSSALGFSMEIGAFVAGVALASTEYRESLGARMVGLRDILILFFFIELGGMFTFTDAAAYVWPAIVLSVFVLIGNPLIVMVIMGLMGYKSIVSFKSGLAVAQISEFSLILIALGFSLGQVNQSVLSLVTMVGLITITLSTYLILYSDPLYRRFAPFLRLFEKSNASAGVEAKETHPYDAIVVGAGRMGKAVISGLRERGATLLVVDLDPKALEQARSFGADTLYGDISEPEFVSELPLHETTVFISAVPDRTSNLVAWEALKRAEFDGDICLTAMDDETAKMFSADSQVRTVRPFQAAANRIVDTLGITLPDKS